MIGWLQRPAVQAFLAERDPVDWTGTEDCTAVGGLVRTLFLLAIACALAAAGLGDWTW